MTFLVAHSFQTAAFAPLEGERICLELANGWTVVELVTPTALEREGMLMGNCLGSGLGSDRLLSGLSEFLSLRDPAGRPHVTLEWDSRSNFAVEIAGRGNRFPVNRHWSRLRAFFESRGALADYLFVTSTDAGAYRLGTDAECTIASDPRAAALYAEKIIGGRWRQAEPAIASDPNWAFVYSKDVLGRRWPEGEPAILTDACTAVDYAIAILRHRWPQAERIIARDARAAVGYARHILRGRWMAAERAIMQSPCEAVEYARHILGCRWAQAEPFIVPVPAAAVTYAENVIGGRWPEAEAAILTDVVSSATYSRRVLKARWAQAEPLIATVPQLVWHYRRACLR